MFIGTIFLIIIYLFLKYILSWIVYINKLDPRLGDSTWRWSYDYPVIGNRDISDLDDKPFVRQRRKRNKIVTIMYFIVIFAFVVLMYFLAKLLFIILG